MEEAVTLCRSQLIKLFEAWNANTAENGYAEYDDPKTQASSQADEFMRQAALVA